MEKSEELRKEIKMFQANDYEVYEETSEYVIMRKSGTGCGMHILIFLCTAWFTFGLGNVAYHFLSIKKKKIMK